MYGCSGYILIVHYSFLCRFCKRVMSSYCKPIRHCLRHRGHGSAWKRWTGRDCWWPTIYMTNNISKALQDALRLVTAGKSLTWMCSCRIFLKLLVFFCHSSLFLKPNVKFFRKFFVSVLRTNPETDTFSSHCSNYPHLLPGWLYLSSHQTPGLQPSSLTNPG